jgi:hypothetical protein
MRIRIIKLTTNIRYPILFFREISEIAIKQD